MANVMLILLGHAQVAFLLNAVHIIVRVLWVGAAMAWWLSARDVRTDDALPLWMVRLVLTFALLIAPIGVARTVGYFADDGATIEGFLIHVPAMSATKRVGLQYRSRKRRQAMLLAEQRRENELRERRNLQACWRSCE